MARAFNAREGFTREDDKLPAKFWKALEGGETDGIALDPAQIEQAKDVYYEMSGWDVATGTPGAEKLDALGLGWVAEML